MDCCSAWDGAPLIAETTLAHARLDGYAVVPGHALVIPKRHVDRFIDLAPPELLDMQDLIAGICHTGDTTDYTIAVNDGPLAGRTVAHLHIHVIPRRAGDVADPRGGVRRLLIPDITQDPWITHR